MDISYDHSLYSACVEANWINQFLELLRRTSFSAPYISKQNELKAFYWYCTLYSSDLQSEKYSNCGPNLIQTKTLFLKLTPLLTSNQNP